ncbi:uncharacterized protein N7518_001885 [Penicillium psychrosexuale]|uniref:uncharacterized protein n=1 Tax=Penicillium psychrosexuale TaxID=1002107 RepID=UPI002544F211|nr:uncharacterized protein N7518_001885 [Penicillium psychrosexuale]KAJ5799817.1 hypothetical protein N7518_001885 [Penicillium psychrosexuale]
MSTCYLAWSLENLAEKDGLALYDVGEERESSGVSRYTKPVQAIFQIQRPIVQWPAEGTDVQHEYSIRRSKAWEYVGPGQRLVSASGKSARGRHHLELSAAIRLMR